MLYLARHGETDWNIAKRVQGKTDIPLNENGIRQAEQLAARLEEENLKFRRIYTSRLERARKTAETAAEKLGAGVVVIDGLEEINLGKWEGLTWEQAKERYPREFGVWFQCRRETRPPEGESYQDLLDRMIPALKKILEEEPGDVLVVTHSGNIMTLMSLIHGKPFEDMAKNYQMGNAQIQSLDREVILRL